MKYKDNLKDIERYKGFTFLEAPVPFDQLMEGRDIPLVQVHDVDPDNDGDIMGFAGVFEWKGGEISSLDRDSYYKGMLVVGYSWFVPRLHSAEGVCCLDILVTGGW